MSHQAPGFSGWSWAEDQYDEHAELIALASDVFGVAPVPPSRTPSRTDTPPPTQSTPTPHKKGKKKHKNEDPHTPRGPRPTPSDAGSADESEEVSPSPVPQSSSSKDKAPAPRPVIFDTPPPLIPRFFPESKHSGDLVAMLECANNALMGWCRSSRWEDSRDRMRIAHHLALTLKICA
jgi:hypothetical protein